MPLHVPQTAPDPLTPARPIVFELIVPDTVPDDGRAIATAIAAPRLRTTSLLAIRKRSVAASFDVSVTADALPSNEFSSAVTTTELRSRAATSSALAREC